MDRFLTAAVNVVVLTFIALFLIFVVLTFLLVTASFANAKGVSPSRGWHQPQNNQTQGQMQSQKSSALAAAASISAVKVLSANTNTNTTQSTVDVNVTGDTVKTRDNTPDVFAPGLSSGTKPGTVSASVGGSTPGVGLSLGGSYTDEDCNVRASMITAASLMNLSLPNTQKLLHNIACQSAVYRKALYDTAIETGKSDNICLADKEEFAEHIAQQLEEQEENKENQKPLQADGTPPFRGGVLQRF